MIEGNKPIAVARDVYDLNDRTILGYGTVHDVADITMRFGNQGVKVRHLQEMLAYLGYLDSSFVTGRFGVSTVDAVRAFQTAHKLTAGGIANMKTQQLLESEYADRYQNDPDIWSVVDED